MVCNSATRKEKLLYLDDVGDDLNLFVVPVPSHGLQLRHKDRELLYLDDIGDAVMVCNSATRIEKLLYLDNVGDDLNLFVVPVPSHCLHFATKIENILYLDNVGDDLPSLVVPVPSHGLQLSHKDGETPVPF